MWYSNQLRHTRERIISMEIKKLELRDRRARQDPRPRLSAPRAETRKQEQMGASWCPGAGNGE
jgi:hypothetical protein